MIGSLWRAERPFSYLRVISSGNFLTNHEQFSKLCKKGHISRQQPGTAVWCKGLSELSCAILESFNILCNLWSKIIHLRKSGLHIDMMVESM